MKNKMNKRTNDINYCNELEITIQTYEEAISGYASRTRQMIVNRGNIGALEQLMKSPDLQKGFKTLRDKNMLDKTFEALIIKFQNEFNKDAVEVAKWRIDNPRWDDNN